MPAGIPYLGYPGALQALASPAPGYSAEDVIRGGTHELLSGGNVRDRVGVRRRYTLPWPAMTDASWHVVRSLVRIPGPFRYQDPIEPNLLTANQSLGTDELRTTDGIIARFQGTVSSSTAQQRSWQRAAAWATGTALAATDRGFYLYNSNTAVDSTWTAVRPSTQYTVSGYLRSTAAVSMKAGWDWHNAAGTYLSTDLGSGVALSTSNFNTRVTHTATSPSTAAYGIPIFLNSNTTGAAITVYLDEVQMEQAAAASTFRAGVGTPWVSVESLAHDIVLADGATTGAAIHNVELSLLEVG